MCGSYALAGQLARRAPGGGTARRVLPRDLAHLGRREVATLRATTLLRVGPGGVGVRVVAFEKMWSMPMCVAQPNVDGMSIVQNQKLRRSASVGSRSVQSQPSDPTAEWSST